VTAPDESAVASYKSAHFIPQASGTGSGNPPLLFTITAVAVPKGLLEAVVSENAHSVYAITSPCLLCV